MKQFIFFKKNWILFLFVFILNSNLLAQTPCNPSSTITYVDNGSCQGGSTNGSGACFSFPVPAGLTLGQLNHLETDFQIFNQPSLYFVVVAQAGCGQVVITFWISDPNTNNWENSGNVAGPGSEFGYYSNFCGQPPAGPLYSDALALYGSAVILSIRLVVDGADFNYVDNTRINNILYNYDDCDGDGVRDIHDCDPTSERNQKWLLCHNGHTICVSPNAVNAHLNHGDYLGPCPNANRGAITDFTDYADEFKLSNAPNPLSTTTTIHYELPVESKINITLYDPLGKVVRTLVDASKTAGIYDYELDATKLTPGIYYYKMTAVSADQTFIKTEKLMIIR